MKKNILAALIAGTFIVACSGGQSGKLIKAYDGPVQFANVVADCGAGKIELGQTDYYGTVSSSNFAILNTPELCTFTATGNADSVDTSNNKKMPNISYVIPRALLSVGDSITLSPLTTLIAKQIDANTANNITGKSVADIVTQVVTDLYPDLINDTGVNALDMARDMEGTITKLKVDYPDSVSSVIATNNVTSDVLVYSDTTTLTVTEIIETSKAVAAEVIAVNSNYPIATDSTKVKVATFDVEASVKAVADDTALTTVSTVENDMPEEPVPATGGSNF
ncbi:hypothetical protein CXF72_11405 [Psychromonas sp. MB-3u-54]|uniref:hypothetical protein n=1 Tax=Psychromonas sp. MB-3u-54 TaxID=2058319 RepID=UPI000C34FAC1|nr:hypothetical protein [Psychromonas sp. MB-3u-54]PKH02476.1 hypothetical protein CXF72_11405 [Psychromonas sp. MB-3u-54]